MHKTLRVQLLPGGIPPKRQTVGAAAYDLFTPTPLALQPGLHTISLKIKIELPPNSFGNIRCRSSHAKNCVSVEAGIIDEDYRGELKVLLRIRQPLVTEKGRAIAQMIVQPYMKPDVVVVDSLGYSDRGGGSFGSTDAAMKMFHQYKD